MTKPMDPWLKDMKRILRILQRATGDPNPCIFAMISEGDCPLFGLQEHRTIIAMIKKARA